MRVDWSRVDKSTKHWHEIMHCYLPSCEAWSAEKVTARLYPHVLVVLGADFTQLECATHFAV